VLVTDKQEFWFVVGSQKLYDAETLRKVESNSVQIANHLNEVTNLSNEIKFKGVMTDSEEILKLIKEVNYRDEVAGIITWMHTFSPAKMWIPGMKILQKPQLHLATQFTREIPWESIDMDYLNLHQSAHGDREFGFMNVRLKKKNKVLVGHWTSDRTKEEIVDWMKAAIGASESERVKVARFGDNMRNVAVTEGDKLEAAIKFGWTVNYYGIGDLVEYMKEVHEDEIEEVFQTCRADYTFDYQNYSKETFNESVKEQIRMEIALRKFLKDGGYTAFTTNFESSHGLRQVPGLAVQRLSKDGYGFSAEGDWKTAAMSRVLKTMANNKRTGFLEDYTYNYVESDAYIMQSHMLEVDPTFAQTKPRLMVAPLSIGGKEDPARLVFDGPSGTGVVASVIDMGDAFKLLINKVEALTVDEAAPHLKMARIMWKPYPSFEEGIKQWIEAGGGHHTVASFSLTVDQLINWANIMDLEYQLIE